MPASDREDLAPALDIIWLRPPKKTRGQRLPLSQEQIVRVAVELADTRGLEAVSTRSIASRLGVAAASLYWHVPSKGDLHELMFDSIISRSSCQIEAQAGATACAPSPAAPVRCSSTIRGGSFSASSLD